MKKPIRLKSGGFMLSGSDAGDLATLRNAKNIDDGSGNGSSNGGSTGMKNGGRLKSKVKKISSMLKKASKAHAGQAKTLDALKLNNGGKLKTRKKQKEVAELKRKAEAKKNLSKSGPPSEKELVSSVRREMQMREKFKTSTPKIMKAKEKRVISNRIGEPKTLKATRRRRKLDEDIFKKAKATQIPTSMSGGGKTKSRVNEAGNYTKPGLRKRIFNRIKAGGKGGAPGQWSARKAQMMAKAYKKAGGGYRG
tara:strand:+ start:769 stop:1521 length:753 start_codon:yes stop_codon:yes gene_type:complete